MAEIVKIWLEHREWWFNGTMFDELIKSIFRALAPNEEHPPIDQIDLLGRIIWYDQIMRHFNRDNYTSWPTAIKYARQFVITDSCPSLHICFALMPFRHSPNEDDRLHAVCVAQKYYTRDSDMRRFYSASLIRVRNTELVEHSGDLPEDLLCSTYDRNFKMRDAPISINIPDVVAVSVSGGSDSMLCLYLAKQAGKDVIAIMIDYGNRPEHNDEVLFVAWFCRKINVPLYVRRIKELVRIHGACDREFYEEVTRKIRFRAYLEHMRSVILGHNLDDCFENCITNMLKGKSKDNLFGMTPQCNIDGVELLRPILHVPKAQIVQMCTELGIPFLKDSTPEWSQRGRIRDILVPAMKQIDDNLIPQVMQFCQTSSEMHKEYIARASSIPIIKESDTVYSVDSTQTNPIYWEIIVKRLQTMFNLNPIRTSTIHKSIGKNNTLSTQLKVVFRDRAYFHLTL